jgi:CheY-like chemotaxis protein/two-component sensor histidine kinase
MNGVLGNLELLDDKQLNNSQRALVGNAKRAADSLLEIINEILDFSRVESGRLELESNEFHLEELLHDVASSISGLLNPAEVEMVVDFDPALPETILGDRLRLRQVLTNLLGNATKFTSSGSIVLQATLQAGQQLQLTVRDSGIGIEAEQLSVLFEPFTQADSSISRHYGGTGLGLSITRQLVELMGGEVDVESEPGKGSLFRVRLPLNECAPPSRYATPPEVSLTCPPRDHVVVLTGNEHLAEALTRSLDSMTLAVSCVEDESAAQQSVSELGARLLALIVDPSPALNAASPVLGAALRDALVANGARIMVLLPAGVAIPPDMARDTSVLKPVKRAELHAALSCSPSAVEVEPVAGTADSAEKSVLGEVLLVDDNPMNLQVAQAMLEKLSLAVVAANSAEQALSYLAERDFDIVLMDEQMPGMDGLEATRILREREQLAVNGAEDKSVRTVVVALTANADSDAQERCLAAGMDGFLAKPVRRKALRAMLARWISGLPAESVAND